MKLNIVSIRAAIQTLGTPTTEGHARDQSQGGVLKYEGVCQDADADTIDAGKWDWDVHIKTNLTALCFYNDRKFEHLP